jgi:hypothetical protein
MGVSHRYRLLSVRGPRMVMRARRGAASRGGLLASVLQAASSIKARLKLFAPPVATTRRPRAFYGSS